MSRFKNDYTDFNIEFSPTIEQKTVNLKSDEIKLGGVSKFNPKKDNTKYDIELNGFSLISLAKNRAVFYFVRYLLENGVNPSEFTERDFGLWYNKKLIIGVRGTVNSEEFIRLARAEHIKMRESFDPTRYYCRDKELIKINGWTYAIYNQWTAESFKRVISHFKREYPNIKFDYSAVE